MFARHLSFGILFGFILSRIGATDYSTIAAMFHLTDLHLMGVMAVAISLTAVGFAIIRTYRLSTPRGEPILLIKKNMTPWLVPGALLFGAGWALAGSCPGTTLAQIGEGRVGGVFVLVGILVGSALAPRFGSKVATPYLKSILKRAHCA